MSKSPSQSPPSALSAPSTSTLEDSDSRLAGAQLLSELAQAAASTMVSIRSYEHEFEDTGPKAQLKTAFAALKSKKRKSEDEAHGTLEQDTSKRQRSSMETANADKQKHNHPFTKGSGRSSLAGREAQDIIEESPGNPQKEVGAPVKHRRFGSEESDIDFDLTSQSAAINGDEEFEGTNEIDSGSDDAPEAITTAAGFEASRAAALDAVRLAEVQQSALRAKRRKHDARLKAQAEAAKSQRHPETSNETMSGATNLKNDMDNHASEGQRLRKKSTKATLPALLPDELLTADPIVQLPKRPSPVGRNIVSKKTKLLDIDQNVPKDIKRGNRIIRVVQVERSILPPPSSATSKAIRERWLTGQRGSLGAPGVPRRKLNGGFVRK